ncbi:hypothetical protein [Telluribacter sp. SYSU D00476]|uniref:hypothetical protein n=1 Tax=Telluribacter sp. SYSU D00476 TaxID=2811430 RepID=UPI001FF6386E|nr:hypothetical protein [Telluribacter sp. SYSU D00476]
MKRTIEKPVVEKLYSPGQATSAGLTHIFLLFSVFLLLVEGFSFLLGYVRPEVSYSLLLLFLVGVAALIRKSRAIDFRALGRDIRQQQVLLIFTAVVSAIILAISGIGGLGYQHPDHYMGDTLLNELMVREWPLWIEEGELKPFFKDFRTSPLTYYYGHYMPAALVGKLLGWKAAVVAMIVWSYLKTYTVLVLTFLYVLNTTASRRTTLTLLVLMAVLFVFTSGLGVVGWYIRKFIGQTPAFGLDSAAVWDFPFLFTSHARIWLWVPQHGLSAWLAVLLVVYALNTSFYLPYLLVVLAPVLITTPFAAVGLVPFLVLLAVKTYRRNQWKALFSGTNVVVGGGIFLCGASYLLSNTFGFPVKFLFTSADPQLLVQYILFLLVELGLPAFLLYRYWHVLPAGSRTLYTVALMTLCCIPFLMIGAWNDWCARASIPAIFVVGILLCQGGVLLLEERKSFSYLVLGLGILGMASTVYLSDLGTSIKEYRIQLPRRVTIADHGESLATFQRIGSGDSFFFKYLAKERPHDGSRVADSH